MRHILALVLLLGLSSLAAAQDESYGVGVGPQAGVPVQSGDFSNYVDWGRGIHAHFRYLPNESIAIHGHTGYLSWQGNTEVPLYAGSDTSTTQDYDTIPLMIGVQQTIKTFDWVKVYVTGEVGFRFYNINQRNLNADGSIAWQESLSETKLSFAPGIGVTWRLGDYSYADAALRYEHVSGGLSYVSLTLSVGYRPYPEY